MRKLWPGFLALGAVVVFGLLNLHRLPAELPTHWNIRGEVDGWTGKNLAVVLLPGIGLAIGLLLAFLPKVDPRRANFPLHEDAWWLIANTLLLFLAGVQLFVIGSGLGWAVSMERVIGVGVGGLMVVMGNYLTRVRQNWFLGIRTPWTLSSEKSWRETHRLGGWLFVAGGLFILGATLVTSRLAPWAVLVGVGVPAVVSLVYSYLVWRNDPESGGKPRGTPG